MTSNQTSCVTSWDLGAISQNYTCRIETYFADMITTPERKLIDYTQQGRQLPNNPSYPKNERPRMRGVEAQLRQSSISSFDRDSKFNLASGKLFQRTLELLRNIEASNDEEEMVEFYLKIPSREQRRQRDSDLRERFFLNGHDKEPNRPNSSIFSWDHFTRPNNDARILKDCLIMFSFNGDLENLHIIVHMSIAFF